jgi:hypothetical protein
VKDRIRWIVSGELDYYHIWDAARKLEEIKKSADRFRDFLLFSGQSELAAALAGRFLNDMPVELVAQVAGAAPEEGAALCRMRINEDILRSHIDIDKC